MAGGNNINFGCGKISIAFPDLQLSGCMTVCKLLNLLEPQLSYLKKVERI